MLYIQQSLGPNEELVHIGRFHAMYTVQAFMAVIWGLIGSLVLISGAIYAYQQLGKLPMGLSWLEALRYVHPGLRIFAFVIFALGLLAFAQKMVIKATTEIALTNIRLVFKRGLVARQVGEMQVNRIEGVDVRQTVLGRLFDYGRLAIRGMGVGEVYLPPIEDPIAFRKAIQQAKAMQTGEML